MINKLLDSDETVFIGAIVSNQKEFYTQFDKVFVLKPQKGESTEGLKQRLLKTMRKIIPDTKSKGK